MPDNLCKWKSKHFPEYQCHELPLDGDEKGWCILHSEEKDKDIQKFTDKVNERITKGRLTPSGWETDKIDLVGCYFPREFRSNYFSGRKFDKPVNFRQVKFLQAYFTESEFSQTAIFTGATFSQAADFRRAAFSQNADFSVARFSHRADFNGATFSQEANFYVTEFSHRADFSLAMFSQRACFSSTTFSQEVRFIETKFSQDADFREAKFLKGAYFTGAGFSRGANFIEAEFLQADFKKTTFSESADFLRAMVSQADFEGTVFEGKARFDRAEFGERVFFAPFGDGDKKRDTEFGPGSSFFYTRFLGEVRFQDVDLSQCSFLHSNIDKVDFRYCEFGKKKGRQNVLKDERDCIKNVKKADKGPFPYNGRVFIDTAEERRARGGYEPARRLYIELKKNFEDKRDWNTAGDFHYGEMECRRNMKEGWLWRNILSLEAIYFWLSGYGERPLRAAVSLGLLIGVCAVLYVYFEGFVGKFEGDYIRAFLKSGCDSLKITTLQRIGHVDKYASLPANAVFMFESIMGPILIALLALALRRKVKR